MNHILLPLSLLACVATLSGQNIQSFLDQEGVGGNLFGIRSELRENGVDLFIGYDGEVWSNLGGGTETGTKFMGLGTVQTTYDLELIAGLKGSSISADGLWYEGSQPTELLIGADPATNVSGAEAGSDFWRFYQLYFQQDVGDSISFRIGQLAADETFMSSDYGSLFINAQFGALPTMADNLNGPIYPLPAPGVYGQWAPANSHWFAKLGLYTADVGEDISSNIGFGWRLGGDAGIAIFAESGRHYSINNLPGTATLGFIGATNQIPNYQTGLTDEGFYSIYGMLDQAITLNESDDPRFGYFMRFAYNPQSARSQQQYYIDGGFSLQEPIPGRLDDSAGIAIGYERFYGHFRASQTAAGEPISKDQAVLELTYSVQVNRWLTVQPDFQIFFDPQFSRENAYVVGARASLIF